MGVGVEKNVIRSKVPEVRTKIPKESLFKIVALYRPSYFERACVYETVRSWRFKKIPDAPQKIC